MKALAIAVCMCLLAAPIARADYESGFEYIVGSPAGTVLTGQDGFYLPAGSLSVDYLVYTYSGNALGLPQNPTGGLQFVGGTGPAGDYCARAERGNDFSGGVQTVAYDFCGTFVGTAPTEQYLGSFSLQNGTDFGAVIHLMSWVNLDVPTTYNAFYVVYDAAGTMVALPGASPGPEWEGLEINHWYRSFATADPYSNRITEVGIIDLETMQETIYYPSDWYMEGGAAGVSAVPFAFRLFAGGGIPGNTLAFDNASMTHVSTPVEETSWGAIKAMFR